MSNILVVAEHLDGELKKASAQTVGFAKAAQAINGGQIIGLVMGSGAQAVAEAMSKTGVDKVVYVDSPALANILAENIAPVVAAVAKQVDASIVATPASTTGRDFLPRVAAELEAGMISDVIEVYNDSAEGISYKRPIWAGNVIAKVTSDTDITCVTVRTTAFAVPAEGSAPVETASIAVADADNASFVAFQQVKSDRPALTDAPVVISGGRGLKSKEAFGMLEELADKLNGAIGASRAAVDSGYAPNDWQVGQTGKIVAPNLYIAVAISGAIQHLAGMKGSKYIVAINTDAEAPIFGITDYGLIADAFKAVPELTSKL